MPTCLFHKTTIKEDSYFGMKCVKCIEEAAIRSAQNMGIADAFYCGHCGMKASKEDMEEHLKANPYGTCY